jgi:nucleoside-diphosphate kinase
MEELTLAIIKPDAVQRNLIGKIVAHYEQNGLSIAAMKLKQVTRHEAEGFYAEHKARPFFGELVEFMSSSPVVLMVLRGKNAILLNREIMGATDPSKAADGTIRKLYAKSIGENSVHGSDSPQSAQREVNYFFASTEIYK